MPKREAFWLNLIPLWNATTGNPRQRFSNPVKVLGEERGTRSQSGLLLLVTDDGGNAHWLDSHWFEEYQEVPRGEA